MAATGSDRDLEGRSHGLGLVFFAGLLACSACATAANAAADAYPTKPLRLIVPYPPGGGSDVMGRALAERMSRQLGHQMIVDNRGGASTVIGAELAARAPADGYTLLVGTITTLATNPNLRTKLPYDPIRVSIRYRCSPRSPITSSCIRAYRRVRSRS
jgi:tripartite-type tricarboxylate transporter receptor subunit TctC